MEDIKFYNFGEESNYEVINYDNKKLEINNVHERKKEDEIYSKTFTYGMKNILDKDIIDLSNKVEIINRRIINILSVNSISTNYEFDFNIKNIDAVLNTTSKIIDDISKQKNSIKIGIFTSKKQEKRKTVENLNSIIESITKSKNDLIALKDEYEKICKRKEKLI